VRHTIADGRTTWPTSITPRGWITSAHTHWRALRLWCGLYHFPYFIQRRSNGGGVHNVSNHNHAEGVKEGSHVALAATPTPSTVSNECHHTSSIPFHHTGNLAWQRTIVLLACALVASPSPEVVAAGVECGRQKLCTYPSSSKGNRTGLNPSGRPTCVALLSAVATWSTSSSAAGALAAIMHTSTAGTSVVIHETRVSKSKLPIGTSTTSRCAFALVLTPGLRSLTAAPVRTRRIRDSQCNTSRGALRCCKGLAANTEASSDSSHALGSLQNYPMKYGRVRAASGCTATFAHHPDPGVRSGHRRKSCRNRERLEYPPRRQ